MVWISRALLKPGIWHARNLVSIRTVERDPGALGVGLMIIVWRSHCDKRKEIEYNDFLGVLIVSSKSQAHNDDC